MVGETLLAPADRFVDAAGLCEQPGDLGVVVGETQVVRLDRDQLVGIASRERDPDPRVADPEPFVRPVLTWRECRESRFEQSAVLVDPIGTERVGVHERSAVERVELARKLQLHEPPCERDRIDARFGARPHVQVAEPRRDGGDPPVRVVDVLDRLLGPGVRVLDQLDNLDRETRVEEFLQLVEGLVHTKRPIRGVAVVDEAAGAERALQTAAADLEHRSSHPPQPRPAR